MLAECSLYYRSRRCETCSNDDRGGFDGFERPPKSSHCHVCNNCVRGYDHHCNLLNNCIGRRNMRIFCVFLATSLLTSLLVPAVCMYQVIKLRDTPSGHPWLWISSSLLVVFIALKYGDSILTSINLVYLSFTCYKAMFLLCSFIASGTLLYFGLTGLGLQLLPAYSCALGLIIGIAYSIMIWPMVFDYLHPETGLVANHLTQKEKTGRIMAE